VRRFRDRAEAGRLLADRLVRYAPAASGGDVGVLALPRGGVPVAYEVARALGAPLDVFLVRKLGVPGYAEYAMGAIASGGVRVLNEDVVAALRISEALIEEVTAVEREELDRRERAFRGARPPPALRGRTVLVVDDGLATGATMRAAVLALHGHGPARIVAAAPVGPVEAVALLERVADEAVCLRVPRHFEAVGLWYDVFGQTSDDEVRALLAAAADATDGSPTP
jgi:putative phosphoribosyl transferase